MPADTIAIEAQRRIPQAAIEPHYRIAVSRSTVHLALAVLAACSCYLVQAADLPPVSSDSSPVADNRLGQSPVLQTNSKVLPVDTAFALTSFIEADTSIVLKWEMPPGYYLYQKSLVVENAAGMTIDIELPAADEITDEFFGDVRVYHNSLLLHLPFAALDAKAGTTVDLMLTYQGCAEALYCYPPEQKALTLKLPE